jgi:hypothetical protein
VAPAPQELSRPPGAPEGTPWSLVLPDAESPLGKTLYMSDAMRGQARKFLAGFKNNSVYGAPVRSNVLTLIGPVKSGKSTLLQKTLPVVMLDIAAKNPGTFAPVFLHYTADEKTAPEDYYKNVRAAVVEKARLYGLQLPESQAHVSVNDLTTAVDSLADYLNNSKRQLVLLLDEIQAPVLHGAAPNLDKAKEFVALFKTLARRLNQGRLVLSGSGMITTLLSFSEIPRNGTDFFRLGNYYMTLGQPLADEALALHLTYDAAQTMPEPHTHATVDSVVAAMRKVPLLVGQNPPLFPRLPMIIETLAFLPEDEGDAITESAISSAIDGICLKVTTESSKDLVAFVDSSLHLDHARDVLVVLAKVAYREQLAEDSTLSPAERAKLTAEVELTEADLTTLNGQVARGLVMVDQHGTLRLLPPYGELLRKQLTIAGQPTIGSFLLYYQHLGPQLLWCFEMAKHFDVALSKTVSRAVLAALAPESGAGKLGSKSRAQAVRMHMLEQFVAMFRRAQGESNKLREKAGLDVREHATIDNLEAYTENPQAATKKYRDAVGLEFLFALRHYHVHLQPDAQKLGSALFTQVNMSPDRVNSVLQAVLRALFQATAKDLRGAWYTPGTVEAPNPLGVQEKNQVYSLPENGAAMKPVPQTIIN